MQDSFESWVRVLCGGSFALAAYVAYAALVAASPDNAGRAAFTAGVLAVFAAGFAFWPERLAYLYRHGVGVPRWSKGTSVTKVDETGTDPSRAGVAGYRPSLAHLRSAFFSIVLYAVMTLRLPDARAAALVWGILLAAAAILYLATRNTPAEPGDGG
jgi:hypothetical protein